MSLGGASPPPFFANESATLSVAIHHVTCAMKEEHGNRVCCQYNAKLFDGVSDESAELSPQDASGCTSG